MNESCHTYEWVMSHIWMSHVTRMNKSCHTYEWVMSHRRHACSRETCHTHEWVMSHVWHALCIMTVTCLITMDTGWRRLIGYHISIGNFLQKSAKNSSYASFVKDTWRITMKSAISLWAIFRKTSLELVALMGTWWMTWRRTMDTSHGTNMSLFVGVPWLFRLCNVRHSYVWHVVSIIRDGYMLDNDG